MIIDKIQARVENEVPVEDGWVFNKNDADKLYDNILILSEPAEYVLRIEYISVVEKNQGTGTHVMQIICEEADAAGYDVELEAYPTYECSAYDVLRLMRFYKRFGFKETNRDELARFFCTARHWTEPASYSDVVHTMFFDWVEPFWMGRE